MDLGTPAELQSHLAAAYIRTSTEEQSKAFGPKVQEADCRAYANKAGQSAS